MQCYIMLCHVVSFVHCCRNDPTIHSWDLANEPRCEGDGSCSRIAAWIHTAAAHVKSLDSRHLVTCGLEGFFGSSSPGECEKLFLLNAVPACNIAAGAAGAAAAAELRRGSKQKQRM
jgi:mannan endo-1,4-beta-mannosidase